MTDRILTSSAWRGFRLAHFPDASWEAECDVLHARPVAGGVCLVSLASLTDFDLTLEWRLPAGGNSGIFYRVTEDCEAPWQSAPEMQLLHDAGHPDGRVPKTSCGALYGVQAAENVPPCPPGIYNIARVHVRGTHVEHWLNGVKVLGCDLADRSFRARVARSKFRDYPRFATARRGLLGLQHHGGEVWFRNVRIQAPPW
jgi:hypothetical protein